MFIINKRKYMSFVDHASVILQFRTMAWPLEQKLYAVDIDWLRAFEAQKATERIDNTKLVEAKYIGELPVMREKMVENKHYKLVTPK